MGFLLSLLFGFVPMFFFAWFVYWLDRYEKEPRRLLVATFLWGAVIAAGAAFLVNTTLGIGIYLFTSSESFTEVATGALVAPVVEEIVKGLAVLIVFLRYRHEFDSILDGIVYAAIAALGFAATENVYYIYKFGYLEGGMAGIAGLIFVRVFLVGWQHPFYTSFTGIGLALARMSRFGLIKFLAPLGGLGLAMFTHALHNTVSAAISGPEGLFFGAVLDWTGWFFMFVFILIMISREQRLVVRHLREEVAQGIIQPGQYHTACSAWAQSLARLSAITQGRYRATDRFYQLCAELAHKKEQYLRMGEEGRNSELIARLREELAKMSAQF